MKRSIGAWAILLASSAGAQAWTQLPDFPGAARDDASSFVIGHDIYLGTGMDAGFTPLDDWWRFNAADLSWAPIATLPASGRLHCSAFTIDGVGYLFGGIDAGGYLNELWSYDPSTNSWTQEPSLPGFGRMSGVGFAIGPHGYVATGRYGPDLAITNELWRFDPPTSTWTQLSSLPGGKRLLGTAVADGEFGYVLTGQDSSQTGVTDCWKYDPANDTWSPLAALPSVGHFGACAFRNAFQVVLLTGATTYPTPYLNDCFLYSIPTNAWIALPSFIGPGRKGAIGGHVDGHGLFFGLGCGDTQRFADWYRFDWPVGLAEVDPDAAFSLLLTAGGDDLTVLCPDVRPNAQLSIASANGAIVHVHPLTGGRTRISLRGLSDGAYILTLTDDRGRSTQRFCLAR